MRVPGRNKKSNNGGLISGIIYIGLGAISLASYFMERKGIKMKFMQEKLTENKVYKPVESEEKISVMQN